MKDEARSLRPGVRKCSASKERRRLAVDVRLLEVSDGCRESSPSVG